MDFDCFKNNAISPDQVLSEQEIFDKATEAKTEEGNSSVEEWLDLQNKIEETLIESPNIFDTNLKLLLFLSIVLGEDKKARSICAQKFESYHAQENMEKVKTAIKNQITKDDAYTNFNFDQSYSFINNLRNFRSDRLEELKNSSTKDEKNKARFEFTINETLLQAITGIDFEQKKPPTQATRRGSVGESIRRFIGNFGNNSQRTPQ